MLLSGFYLKFLRLRTFNGLGFVFAIPFLINVLDIIVLGGIVLTRTVLFLLKWDQWHLYIFFLQGKIVCFLRYVMDDMNQNLAIDAYK